MSILKAWKNDIAKNGKMVEEEKAEVLALLAKNEGNIAKTSRELDVTPYMLRKLRDTNLELYQEARKRMAEALEDKVYVIANKYANEILRRVEDEEALKGMKIKELAVTMGIAVDKLNVMATVRGKFGETQKAAEGLSGLTEEEFQNIVDAEYRDITAEEPKADEDLSGTPKDELPVRPKRVSTIGSFLHRSDSSTRP